MFPGPVFRLACRNMGFAVRLSLLYAGIFGTIGVQMPFLPLWLAAKGLDAPAIGALLAAGTAARLIAVPLGTRAADRLMRPGAALVLAAAAGAAAMTLLGLAHGRPAIFFAYTLATAGFAIVLPLADSQALHGLSARGESYGPVRLWGSAAFVAANLAAGWLMMLITREAFIWLIALGYWVTVATAFLLCAERAAPAPRPPLPRSRHLRGSILLVLAASSLIQASHALLYGFSTLQWTAAGITGPGIGALWAVGVMAEIALFAFSTRLPALFAAPLMLMTLGGAGAVLRWAAMAFDPAPAWLPWLQGLHGLSFGATHLGAVQFIAQTAAAGRTASAQGSLAWANGLVMAGAMAAAGMLYSAFGAAAYAAMAAMAAGGAACAVAARRYAGATP